MPAEFATKGDLGRVEGKVDALSSGLNSLALAVQKMSDQLSARDALEKQAEVLKAEVAAARAAAAAERELNEKAWTDLKTRALWTAMLLLTGASYPNIVNAIKSLKALLS